MLIDFEGFVDGQPFQGGKADDYLLTLGSGSLIDNFEDQLAGASPGDEVEVEVTFPDEYQEPKLAGEDAVFKVKVKEVREKILPELDDDFASDASEFDTLEELRDDIREKVGAALNSRARAKTSGSPRSTPPSTRPRSRSPTRSSRRGPANAGSGWNGSSPSRGWTPTSSFRCRAKRATS